MAYDRIQRELVFWCPHKRNVPEYLIKLFRQHTKKAETVARTGQGQTNAFKLYAGLQQGLHVL